MSARIASASELRTRLADPPAPGSFSDAELEGLPEPVRRYFDAAVAPGTPLATSACFRMVGSIKLGERWVPFRARQIEAPHHGFVWSARAGVIVGSDRYADGHGAMNWKVFGLVRVMHADGPEVSRSAAGRVGAEAIWVPTAVLPRFGVTWTATDPHHITASYRLDEADIELHCTLGEDARVRSVLFDRWGDPDNTGTWSHHPFGFEVTGHSSFDGVTIPSSGRAGWFYGTDRWSEGEFFRCEITDYHLVTGRADDRLVPSAPRTEAASRRGGDVRIMGARHRARRNGQPTTGEEPRREAMNERSLHVVLGTGPLGLAVARQLSARGDRVRAANRGGRADLPDSVEVVGANVAEATDAKRACDGAAVVYHCANPPYAKWPDLHSPLMDAIIEGAAAAGGRLVFGDNLHAYGPVGGPLTEDLPHLAGGPNGRTRARIAEMLMRAHEAGRIQAAIGRGSDFFGPHAHLSTVGDRVFARAIAGKPAQVLGTPDVPHTVTYIDDFARALVTLGEHDEAMGEVWHVPNAQTVTMREFVRMVFESAGHPPRVRAAPRWGIAMAALFNPTLRGVKEQLYQSERPWMVDSTKFERAFGWSATPLTDAVAATVAWFRNEARPCQNGERTDASRDSRDRVLS